MQQYILALDQGTTSSRAIIFDKQGQIISVAQKEFTQIFPQPGWVEHDAVEIWSTQAGVAAEATVKARINGTNITAIGITNQRETVVVWDRETGIPVYNAIVWQDRRTAVPAKRQKQATWLWEQSTPGSSGILQEVNCMLLMLPMLAEQCCTTFIP
jgi:glycerol kinase